MIKPPTGPPRILTAGPSDAAPSVTVARAAQRAEEAPPEWGGALGGGTGAAASQRSKRSALGVGGLSDHETGDAMTAISSRRRISIGLHGA